MRIDKLLSNMGIGSRKEVKDYIKSGLVEVNGKVITKPTEKVDEDKDEITFKNENITYKKYFYLMLNKPQGVISASVGYSQETVVDLLDDKYQNKGIFPAGRLDKDTEGLVLLTNDGILSHNLLSPKKGIVKKYYAKVEGNLNPELVDEFKKGIYLKADQYLTRPATLEIFSTDECYVYIEEGKYHQVKRMLANFGNTVIYLKRLEIGSLVLDDSLGIGEYRELTDEELNGLFLITNTERQN